MKTEFTGYIGTNGNLCIDKDNTNFTYTKVDPSVSEFLCDAVGIPFTDGDKLVSFGDTFKITVEKL